MTLFRRLGFVTSDSFFYLSVASQIYMDSESTKLQQLNAETKTKKDMFEQIYKRARPNIAEIFH